MTDSPLSRLPSPLSGPAAVAPNASRVFTQHHLKHALGNLLAPGVALAGVPGPDDVIGCQLVGGGIMVLATLAAHMVFRHERHHLAGLALDDVNVVIALDGGGTIEAGSGRFQLGSGDVMFFAASRPATLRVEQACRLLILRVPFLRFCNGGSGRFSDFAAGLALRDSPLRQAACDYVHQVLPSLAGSSLATVAHAEQAFISLLAAAHAQAQPAALAPSRWEQLVQAVERMLGDPDLDVAQLAGALGISSRRVHRLFEMQGQRYGAYLLEQRLEQARADLCRPLHAVLGVAQIGYRAGFNGASHFSRCFRQRYGVSPSAYRSTALAAAGA